MVEQVFAALASRCKPDYAAEKLRDAARVMSLLPLGSHALEKGASRFWHGNSNPYAQHFRRTCEFRTGNPPIFTALLEYFTAHPGKILVKSEIISALYPSGAQKKDINSVTQLLCIFVAGGLIIRQPNFRVHGHPGTQSSFSTRAEHYLKRENAGAKLQTLDFVGRKTVASKTAWFCDLNLFSGEAPANRHVADDLISDLVKLNFIKRERIVPRRFPHLNPPDKQPCKGRIVKLELSPESKDIIVAWVQIPVGAAMPARIWEPIRQALVCGIPLRKDQP